MLEKKKKKEKISLVVLFFAIAAFSLAAFLFSNKTKADVEGWAKGIWNDLVVKSGFSTNTGVPTVGWLKSSSGIDSPCITGQSYEVYFSSGTPDDDERFVSGKAWFGIGSKGNSAADPEGGCQYDLPSLGWLDFGAGAPPFCSGEDCHAARWHKTGEGLTGYLDGWAKITSMSDDGWVRLNDTRSENIYSTKVDRYGIVVNNSYAWNSGRGDALVGNAGLGWIKMDGLKIAECDLSCAPKDICSGSAFSSCDSSFCGSGGSCALGSDNLSWTCSRGCGSIDCNARIVDPKFGPCGELDGKYICDLGNPPTADRLCGDASAYNNDLAESGIVTTWSCGNFCGEIVHCSASARCGWIETNP